jgi:uncharacterized protein (TIGR02996 family)
MWDDQALLAAIEADPAEDTARLAYADWLEEHDRPILAEFIRLQIELAEKAATHPVPDSRIVHRFSELVCLHREEVLGPLAALPDKATVFDRGFPAKVSVGVSEFLKHARTLSSLRPLPEIAVDLDEIERLGEFVRCPDLGCLRRLAVRPPPLPPDLPEWPGDEDILDAADRLHRLEFLGLSGCGVNDLHIDLAFNYSLPALAELDLSDNFITDRGLDNLFATDWPPQLRRLFLGGNPITDVGAVMLAERWPSGEEDKLRTLGMQGTTIGTRGRRALLNRFGGRVELG